MVSISFIHPYPRYPGAYELLHRARGIAPFNWAEAGGARRAVASALPGDVTFAAGSAFWAATGLSALVCFIVLQFFFSAGDGFSEFSDLAGYGSGAFSSVAYWYLLGSHVALPLLYPWSLTRQDQAAAEAIVGCGVPNALAYLMWLLAAVDFDEAANELLMAAASGFAFARASDLLLRCVSSLAMNRTPEPSADDEPAHRHQPRQPGGKSPKRAALACESMRVGPLALLFALERFAFCAWFFAFFTGSGLFEMAWTGNAARWVSLALLLMAAWFLWSGVVFLHETASSSSDVVAASLESYRKADEARRARLEAKKNPQAPPKDGGGAAPSPSPAATPSSNPGASGRSSENDVKLGLAISGDVSVASSALAEGRALFGPR